MPRVIKRKMRKPVGHEFVGMRCVCVVRDEEIVYGHDEKLPSTNCTIFLRIIRISIAQLLMPRQNA
jgi:hypothetical protein